MKYFISFIDTINESCYYYYYHYYYYYLQISNISSFIFMVIFPDVQIPFLKCCVIILVHRNSKGPHHLGFPALLALQPNLGQAQSTEVPLGFVSWSYDRAHRKGEKSC